MLYTVAYAFVIARSPWARCAGTSAFGATDTYKRNVAKYEAIFSDAGARESLCRLVEGTLS